MLNFLKILEKISYLSIGLAIFLLIFNIFFIRISAVEPTDLGLAGKLPLSFWIGLAFVGVIWLTGKSSIRVLTVAMALTVTYLFVIPAIVRIPVWLSNSYYPFGESIQIISSGHLIDRPYKTFNSYYYWPSFLYFSSEFLQITGIPPFFVLKVFPLFHILIYTLLVFSILRIKFKSIEAIYGVGLFLASFWVRQQYFGPPGMGYIFFLLGLLVISNLFFKKNTENNKFALIAIFLLIFIVTTFTHVLSSFMLIVVLVAFYITQLIARHQSLVKVPTLLFFSTVFFMFYNLFSATTFFNFAIKTYYTVFSFERELGIFKEPSRIAGSAAQILNYRSTIAIVLTVVVIALVGMLLILKKQFSSPNSFADKYSLLWLMLSLFLAIFAFTEYGPHEAYQRAFMFGLISLCYFCVIALSKKPKLFSGILLILIFLNIPAQYGADSYTLNNDIDLSGAAFVAYKTPQNITCYYEFTLEIRYYNPLKQITFLKVATLPFTSVPNASYISQVFDRADYVIVSRKQNDYYYYFLNQNPLNQVSLEPYYNRLYDNSGFSLFTQANNT